MRKNIIYSAIFLSGIAVVLILGSLLLNPKNKVYNVKEFNSKISELSKEPDNSIDLVILGDSEVYSAYNPLQLEETSGLSTFLLSTYAQRLCDSYALLEETYKHQSPKVVILETNCFFRYGGLAEETSDAFMNFILEYIPAMKYHSRLKMLLLKPDSNEDSNMKGFVYRTGENAYTGGEWMIPTDGKENIISTNQEYLNSIIELAHSHNSEVIFVTTPSPECQTYERHNSINEFAVEHGISYYDFNLCYNEIGIDWNTDTLDSGNHLNFNGATKLTDYLAKIILNK